MSSQKGKAEQVLEFIEAKPMEMAVLPKDYLESFDRRLSQILFVRHEAGTLHNSFEWGYAFYEHVKNHDLEALKGILSLPVQEKWQHGVLGPNQLRSAKNACICLISYVVQSACKERIADNEQLYSVCDACVQLVEEGGYPTLDLLQTPRFRAREQQIRNAFQTRIPGLLDEQGFISENSIMEFDRIMRYVDIPAHRHTFEELTYVLKGYCYQTVNGITYAQKAGVLTCIASGTEHQTTAAPDCVALSIKIRLAAFQQLEVPSLPMFGTSLYFDCGEDSFVRDTILSMYAQQREKLPYYDMITEKLLEAVLIYCCQTHRDEMYRFFPGVSLQGKMLEILGYMHENYQTVTLHSVAQHFHYSDAYLSNQFHRNTGMTFSELVRTFRLDQARNLLLTTHLKLDEICDRIGYSSVSRFIQDFKEMYRETPHRFRRAANK